MKKAVLVFLFLFWVISGSAKAGSDFDRLKALEGQWESTTPEGKTRVTFKVISNGTAVMETIENEGMVTVYHPDGGAILMTHYCAIGNQPRMRAQGFKGDTLAFQFVDAANMKGNADGHMSRLVIKLQDADHITEEWTWTETGKDVSTLFHLKRVK